MQVQELLELLVVRHVDWREDLHLVLWEVGLSERLFQPGWGPEEEVFLADLEQGEQVLQPGVLEVMVRLVLLD